MPNSEYVPISELRLITRDYGILALEASEAPIGRGLATEAIAAEFEH